MKSLKLTLVAFSLLSSSVSFGGEEKILKACQSLVNNSSFVCELAKGVNVLAVNDYNEAKTDDARNSALARSQKAVELAGMCAAQFIEQCFQTFKK